ncbi:uncharacterized protein [Spinacia oleracea]|uniref:Tc1-like transposase DDE domain-containing protein n=1 Tax=Spinacia oleracea TaxID=3562 RepID=A0ABM3RIA1_SPIOL|nr:uncharacterized protein LOC110796120 [Spinacia oleracea]
MASGHVEAATSVQEAASVQEATSTPPIVVAHPLPPRLDLNDRRLMVQYLQGQCILGELDYGEITKAAKIFCVSRQTISKYWNMAEVDVADCQVINLQPQYANCGRKPVALDVEKMLTVPIKDRTTQRLLGKALDVAGSTINRHIQKGNIKPHTNPLRPGISDGNVHIDEKWFYLKKANLKVYLAPGEEHPYRTAQSKHQIPKGMFLAGVARPIFNTNGVCTFDGKLGIFPFTYTEPAKRSSKNRARGTPITYAIQGVNKDVFREKLMTKMLPAIREKWPVDSAKTIIIQEDNAKPHIGAGDPQFLQEANIDGFTFIWQPQSPQSPDLNILDLGFFRSIQSLYEKKMPKDLDEMITDVEEAFNELHPKVLSNVWHSYQYVMQEIIKVKGGGNYVLPHVKKKQLEDAGNLPLQVQPDAQAIKESMQLLYPENED